ncbi:MAG: DUF4129 domain-containing protein [Candidatus Methanofastidiosia archaeon]
MVVCSSPSPEEIERDLEEILRKLGYSTSDQPLTFPVTMVKALVVIAALALLFFLVFLVLKWIPRPSGERGAPRKREEEILVRKKDYYGLYKAALTLGSEKEYVEAVRFLYMALLVFLDIQNVISYHPSLTNYEYRQKVHPYPFSDFFDKMTRVFDTVYYGGAPATGNDFSQCVEAFTHIQEALS